MKAVAASLGLKVLLFVPLAALFASGCSHQPPDKFYQQPKIDFHQHFKPGFDFASYLQVMKLYQVQRAVVLALKSPDNQYQKQNQLVMDLYRKSPELIVPFITHIEADPEGLAIVKKWHQQGARGVKYIGWLGKQVLRYNYDLLNANQLRVYEYCQANGLIILFHIDFRKGRGLLVKFAKILRKYPKLKVVLAHGGIDFRQLPAFRALLRHPHLYVDLSFYGTFKEYWFAEVSKAHQALRQVILDYPDHFLWATDLFPSSKNGEEYMHNVLEGSVDLVARQRYFRPEFVKWQRGRGLNLPADVLAKVYLTNAQRLLAKSRIEVSEHESHGK